MPWLIEQPTRIVPGGNKPETILEYVGRVNTQTESVSIAHIVCPPGWAEPSQQPEFDEYTVVLEGTLRVEHAGGSIEVRAGQAILVRGGEWIRYSTPTEGASYIAVCLPAFSMGLANRNAE